MLCTIPKLGKGKECSLVGYVRRIVTQFKTCDGVKISVFQILVSLLAVSSVLPYFQFLSEKKNDNFLDRY